MRKAVYAGTFDPPTNGHLDIIKRASKMFDKLIIAVTDNPNKKTLFSTAERIEMLKLITKDIGNVEVANFSGLLIDFMRDIGAEVIIRGLRAVSDFEYEFQLALMNRKLEKSIETVFLIPDESYTYLSSSLVKEIAEFGGDISGLVPKEIEGFVKKKFGKYNY